jgi:hypothetical protein
LRQAVQVVTQQDQAVLEVLVQVVRQQLTILQAIALVDQVAQDQLTL